MNEWLERARVHAMKNPLTFPEWDGLPREEKLLAWNIMQQRWRENNFRLACAYVGIVTPVPLAIIFVVARFAPFPGPPGPITMDMFSTSNPRFELGLWAGGFSAVFIATSFMVVLFRREVRRFIRMRDGA
jgi:hypothetical protein